MKHEISADNHRENLKSETIRFETSTDIEVLSEQMFFVKNHAEQEALIIRKLESIIPSEKSSPISLDDLKIAPLQNWV